MGNNAMRVSEILDLPKNFIAFRVVIEGLFVMEGGVGYFCENVTEIGRGNRSILVNSENLEAQLLLCVPAYGGSKFSYCDSSRISGTLYNHAIGDFEFSIGDVDSFVVYKRDCPINVEIWKKGADA